MSMGASARVINTLAAIIAPKVYDNIRASKIAAAMTIYDSARGAATHYIKVNRTFPVDGAVAADSAYVRPYGDGGAGLSANQTTIGRLSFSNPNSRRTASRSANFSGTTPGAIERYCEGKPTRSASNSLATFSPTVTRTFARFASHRSISTTTRLRQPTNSGSLRRCP